MPTDNYYDDRRIAQAQGTHPAPCARLCESTAYEIEIRSLRKQVQTLTAERDALREALEWYGDRAKQMGRAAIYSDSKRMLELMHEVAVDNGKRAALAQKEQP